MFTARALTRAAAPLRTPVARQAIQKRFAHAEVKLPAGVQDNAFNRERQAVKEHAAASSDLWRKLSIYAVIPALVIAAANSYVLWNEHWEHWAHMEPLEERAEYSYQNIRTKNFFWGDGDKTVFWNSSVNHHKASE